MVPIGDVEARIATLESAAAAALVQLRDGWWQSDDEDFAIREIENTKASRDKWAALGRDAARATAPKPEAWWRDWLASGRRQLANITRAVDFADEPALADFVFVQVPKAAGTVARKAGSAAAAVAKGAGTVTAAAVRPLLVPLAVFAALAVAAVLMARALKVL